MARSPLIPHSKSHSVRFAHLASGARIAWMASGNGPPLVKTAHWMTHVERDLRSPLWGPWIERMTRYVRLVRYDGRGLGHSSPDEAPLSLASAVEDLAAVMTAANLPRAALLGISGGGPPAIAYAVANPERVSHLVLLGSFATGRLIREPTVESRQYTEAMAVLMETGWGRNNPAVRQFFTSLFLPGATPEQAEAMNELQRWSCVGSRAAAIMRTVANFDIRHLLPSVRCPTLVLHSVGDAAVPLEAGRELAAGIPNASFETLATENHVPPVGDPACERFFGVLQAFLTDRSTPDFTPRERDLLQLVGRGLDNLQIAAHLGIAEKTVRNALSHLYERLSVEGRPQAVVRARELGFGN